MTPANRIELELRVREAAIAIATRYGKEGAEFFHSQFLEIAQEYAQGRADDDNREYQRMKTANALFQKELL